MAKRAWLALAVASAWVVAAGPVGAEDGQPAPARIVAVEARPEAGRTVIQVTTTTPTINYISFGKSPETTIVDIYGLDGEGLPEVVAVGSREVRAVRVSYTPATPGATSVARIAVERTAPGPTPVRVEGESLIIEARALDGAARAPRPASRSSLLDPAGPATRLDEVAAETGPDGLTVSIRGDGRLAYESFTLEDPPRLVIDVRGVDNRVAEARLDVAHDAVSRIRVGQFQAEPDKVARVVLDLGVPSDYRVRGLGREIRVGFGAAALAVDEPAAEPPPATLAEAAAGDPPGVLAGSAAAEGDAQILGGAEDEEGQLISLDLKDADIKDVLRYFSEISGLNIILDPGVSGNVTVRLIDVPWNKALDIILKAHGYGKALDGNVLRIADVSKLTQEETLQAELVKQQIEARPVVTITRQVSYGDAQEIANVVQQTALSKKGSIIIDQRTNTLVITEVDIQEYRDRILDLIKTLDTPTPQVEIEARVVETARTFIRSFGVLWGFSHAFDQTTGSTTDLVFPNNGLIAGDLLTNQSGPNSLLPTRGWAVNLPVSGARGMVGIHLASITDQFQLDVALQALEDEGKARVLSAPKITTQSNIAASITSGASIPIQTVANNTIQVQYINANLQLQVTPQVTAENTIILRLTVTNNRPDLSTRVGLTALPPINVRTAQTTVLVPDGGTAVIGGVFQLEESVTQNRIPFAHTLPVIGWLFKNDSKTRTNNELLIFITPKIKRPTGVATAALPVAFGTSAP